MLFGDYPGVYDLIQCSFVVKVLNLYKFALDYLFQLFVAF